MLCHHDRGARCASRMAKMMRVAAYGSWGKLLFCESSPSELGFAPGLQGPFPVIRQDARNLRLCVFGIIITNRS